MQTAPGKGASWACEFDRSFRFSDRLFAPPREFEADWHGGGERPCLTPSPDTPNPPCPGFSTRPRSAFADLPNKPTPSATPSTTFSGVRQSRGARLSRWRTAMHPRMRISTCARPISSPTRLISYCDCKDFPAADHGGRTSSPTGSASTPSGAFPWHTPLQSHSVPTVQPCLTKVDRQFSSLHAGSGVQMRQFWSRKGSGPTQLVRHVTSRIGLPC